MAEYWAANLRQPVRFSQAIAAAAEQHATFIEISPHPLLTHAITETVESVARSERFVVTSAMNRDDDSTLFFHTQLAAVGVERRPPTGVSSTSHRRRGSTRRSGSPIGRPPGEPDNTHPLLGIHTEIPSGSDHVWQADVGTDVCPWLADHRVYGQPVMPGTGYAEIVLAAGAEALDLPAEDLTVKRLEIEQMLVLDGHTRITTQLTRGARTTTSGSRSIRAPRKGTGADTPSPGSNRQPTRSGRRAECQMSNRTERLSHRPTSMPPCAAAVNTTGPRSPRSVGWFACPAVARLPKSFCPKRRRTIRAARFIPSCSMRHCRAWSPRCRTAPSAEAAEATYLPVSFETIRVFGKVGRYARCRAELVGTRKRCGGRARQSHADL